MPENPFRVEDRHRNTRRRPVQNQPALNSKAHQILIASVVLTLMFATRDLIEENSPFFSGGSVLVLFLAVLSQLPGLAVSKWRFDGHRSAFHPMMLAAYAVAATGTAAWCKYAFDGQSDSMTSAAHMHILFFPFLHCIFAGILYVIALVLTVLIGLVFGGKDDDEL